MRPPASSKVFWKPAAPLVPVGEVVGDHRHALHAELLLRVVAHHVHRLRRGAVGVDHVVALALLREVDLRRRHRRQERHLGLEHVVVDGEGFERGERADEDVHLLALDQLLGLGLRLRRLAGGVGKDDLDLPSGERAAALLQEEVDPFLHLPPAGGERTGPDGQEADAQGLLRLDRLQCDTRKRQHCENEANHGFSSPRRYRTSERRCGQPCAREPGKR
jgi:hypothetical protein